MSDVVQVSIDSTTLKLVAGLLVTTIGSLITATISLVRRANRIDEVEVAVLGDPARGRKGLRRIVLGDAENNEVGLVALVTTVQKHEKVVEGVIRGFDVLDVEETAERIRQKLGVESQREKVVTTRMPRVDPRREP